MSPAKKGRRRQPSKRSLEESSSQASSSNETTKETKQITESDIVASISLPNVSVSKSLRPTKRPRMISPDLDHSATVQNIEIIDLDASTTFDDTILEFEEWEEPKQPTNVRAASTSISAISTQHAKKPAEAAATVSTTSESLTSAVAARRTKKPTKPKATASSTPVPPISDAAVRRLKESAIQPESPSTTVSEPTISAMAPQRAKEKGKAKATTSTTPEPHISAAAARRAKQKGTAEATTSTIPEPPISAAAARRAKQKGTAEATISTIPEPPISAAAARRAKQKGTAEATTSTIPEPPISAAAARRAKQQATTSTIPEPPISAVAARRPKESAKAKAITPEPLISALAARRLRELGIQPEPSSTSSTTTTTAASFHSERVPTKIFDVRDYPQLPSAYIPSDTDSNEDTEKYITPKESLTDEFYTANDQTVDDEFVTAPEQFENNNENLASSWKNEERKKKAQWKESNKLMDPYSVSTFSSYNAIPFEHEGTPSYCIAFEKGQKMVFIGYSLIGALYGSIDIGGATISSNHEIPTSVNSLLEQRHTVPFFPVFSPRTSALAVVQSIPYATTATVSPSSTLTSTYSDLNPLLESFLPRLDTLESIIIVKDMQWCGVDQLELINPSLKNLFCLDTKKDFTSNDGPTYEGIVGFQPIVEVTPEVRAMKIDPSWSKAIDSVLEFEQDSSAPSVSMVCGTKNVGKSSFARYMINRLLNCHQRVAYLETDVGQTEFTPSGLVSLHVIQSPLLGPPFTHVLKSERSFFIGSTSPNKDTSYYQDCIQQLTQTYHNEFNTGSSSDDDIDPSEFVPLVVNTSGWVKGLGYDLLLAIVADVVPTHVFPLNPGDGRFGPGLPYHFEEHILQAVQKSSLLEFHPVVVPCIRASEITMPGTQQQQQQITPTSSPHQRPRRFNTPSTLADKYQAADHRSLMLLSYMYHDAQVFGTRQENRGWWNISTRLVDRVPWTIDWRQHLHGIWVLFEDVPPSKLLYALNGSLVGLIGKVKNNVDKVAITDAGGPMENEEEVDAQPALVKMDEGSLSRSKSTIPINYYSPMTTSPPNPATTNCYGLGIIRGVDKETNRIHLLTPIPLEQLEKVNSFVKGDLEIPVHLLLDKYVGSRHENCGVTWRQVPYLSFDVVDTVGSSAPKLRRNLMRRSQNMD